MKTNWFYTYVLLCRDQKYYIGYTNDINQRIFDHNNGLNSSTKDRRPVKLIYYEACRSKSSAMARERYFKTGFGRQYLKKRIDTGTRRPVE